MVEEIEVKRKVFTIVEQIGEHSYKVEKKGQYFFLKKYDRRDELEAYLKENGIGTVKHYPVPMHLQKAYEELNIPEGALPIAEEISKTVLSIPMYYGITNEQVDYVINTINNFK